MRLSKETAHLYIDKLYKEHLQLKKSKIQLSQLQQENKRLKQWDCDKDTRNSRQRVANAKLIKENAKLKEDNFKLDRENQLLFESKLDLIKWLKSELYTCNKAIKFYRHRAYDTRPYLYLKAKLEEILSKLKESTK